MRTLPVLFFLLSLLPAVAPSARAEALDEGQFLLSAGFASVMHDDGVHVKDAFATSAAYYQRILPMLWFGGEVGGFFGAKVGGLAPAADDSDGDGEADRVRFEESALGITLYATPQLKAGPQLAMSGFTLHPYLVAGGGAYGVFIATTESLPDSVPNKSAHGGVNYGGGLTLLLSGGWGFGADFRMHQIIDRGGPYTAYRVLGVNLTWQF